MASSHSVSTVFRAIARPNRIYNNFICNSCRLAVQQQRNLHQHVPRSKTPSPTPFVPDVATFLKLIGRGLSVHAQKFKDWNSLFQTSSSGLKELGIEPARSRRYLLRWRNKFTKGDWGIGGDFQHVSPEGVAELRVIEVPSLPTKSHTAYGAVSTSQTPGMTKLVLNVPAGVDTYQVLLDEGQTPQNLKKPAGVSLKDGHVITGSYVLPVAGYNGARAQLKVVEGMWEDRRGRKLYGGERRRAETLHKMRVAARKNE